MSESMATRAEAYRTPALTGVVLLAALAAVFFCSPLGFLILVCVLCSFAPDGRLKWVLLFSACLLFTVLNISKEIEGDLVTYASLQRYFVNRPASLLLDGDELRAISSTYRLTEFGFYLPLWTLANIFDDSTAAIPIAATLAIYVPAFFGLRLIARKEQWSERFAQVVILFVFFAAINFTQTTHLIRQYTSGAFAFLAFALFLSGKSGRALVTALAACTIHNGTAVLVLDFMLISALFPHERLRGARAWNFIWRGVFAVGILGASFAVIALQEIGHLGLPESDIALWHYVLTGSIFAVFRFYSRADGGLETRMRHYVSLAVAIIYALSIGFFILGLQVLALRYFVYLEWLFGLMLASILCAVPRGRVGLSLTAHWVVCALATLVLLMRINGAAWAYGPGQAGLLTRNLIDVTQYMPR